MTRKSNSYLLTKLQKQLTKNGHNFIKKCFKCFKNWIFQKMLITKYVPLNQISSMKKKILKLQFLKHLNDFLLKLCPFFVSWFWSFENKYENDLRVIFDQWPKLSLGLDVRPEIPILKVIYCVCCCIAKLLHNVTLNPKHQLYGNINFDDILLLTQLRTKYS